MDELTHIHAETNVAAEQNTSVSSSVSHSKTDNLQGLTVNQESLTETEKFIADMSVQDATIDLDDESDDRFSGLVSRDS